MLKLHTLRIRWFYKHCLPKQLPKSPGLYYVVEGSNVLYVGLAGAKRSTLYDRWNSYEPHKMAGFINGTTCRLYYRVMARANLAYHEAVEIRRFNPPYNIQHPDPKKHYSLWSDYCLLFLVTVISIILFAT